MFDSPTLTAKRLREESGVCFETVEEIIAKAEKENRDLTDAERKETDDLMATATTKVDDAKRIERLNDMGDKMSSTDLDKMWQRTEQKNVAPTRAKWVDGDGRDVCVLGRGERLVDAVGNSELRIGNLVRAVVTGEKRFGQREILAAMSESSNPAGGFLVPEVLSAQLIDLARARSVVFQAGAQLVAMPSERMTLARVITDPTFELKVENASFTGSDVTFDAIGLTAKTIGTIVTMSKELAQDAPNITQQVEDVLANSLAAEIDRQFLRGDASAELLGIQNKTGVGSTGSVGAIAWEDVHTAAVDVRTNNHEPTAYVAHPTIAGDLDIIATGDGSTSAKNWLGPPPGVEELTRYQTTNMQTSEVVIGDFEQVIVGLRLAPEITVSDEANEAFDRYQRKVRIVWRGDISLMHAEAFHVLEGVTT